MGQNCGSETCERGYYGDGLTLTLPAKEHKVGLRHNLDQSMKSAAVFPDDKHQRLSDVTRSVHALRNVSSNNPEGRETLTSSSSPQEEGEFSGSKDAYGRPSGYGVLQTTNAKYEGDFVAGEKHGRGVLTWSDGRQYSGDFCNGNFHGLAYMTWPDGRNYAGQYSDNRKYGDGIFTWADGRRYEGQWVDGKRHGRGWYTNARRERRLGIWSRDKPISWYSKEDEEKAGGVENDHMHSNTVLPMSFEKKLEQLDGDWG